MYKINLMPMGTAAPCPYRLLSIILLQFDQLSREVGRTLEVPGACPKYITAPYRSPPAKSAAPPRSVVGSP